jgi:hypothetical protein
MDYDTFPILALPAELSDEAVVQLIEMLHEIARTLENHYAGQVHRYHHQGDDRQPELWDDQDLPF